MLDRTGRGGRVDVGSSVHLRRCLDAELPVSGGFLVRSTSNHDTRDHEHGPQPNRGLVVFDVLGDRWRFKRILEVGGRQLQLEGLQAVKSPVVGHGVSEPDGSLSPDALEWCHRFGRHRGGVAVGLLPVEIPPLQLPQRRVRGVFCRPRMAVDHEIEPFEIRD